MPDRRPMICECGATLLPQVGCPACRNWYVLTMKPGVWFCHAGLDARANHWCRVNRRGHLLPLRRQPDGRRVRADIGRFLRRVGAPDA
jgi:hypothetical protein